MSRIIIDTDILIDVGRRIDKAVFFLERIEKESIPMVSIITQMELIVGCRNKKELNNLDKFLSRFEIVHLDKSVTDKGIELLRKYRLSHGLLIADALIAATAIINGVFLTTKNQTDYKFIEELKMLTYD